MEIAEFRLVTPDGALDVSFVPPLEMDQYADFHDAVHLADTATELHLQLGELAQQWHRVIRFS
jgi:hypothetical protein